MKKYTLFLIFIYGTITAQTNAKKDDIEFEPIVRFTVFQPIQFGDHSLSKDHSSRIGFGSSLSLASYINFKIGVGFDIVRYTITNKSNVGNINNSDYSSIYGFIAYDKKINSKFSIIPVIGYGDVLINLTSNSRKFGRQGGKELRLGSFLDYNINNTLAAFVGVHYIHTSLKVATNAEIEKYYNQANQIQISIGLKIH